MFFSRLGSIIAFKWHLKGWLCVTIGKKKSFDSNYILWLLCKRTYFNSLHKTITLQYLGTVFLKTHQKWQEAITSCWEKRIKSRKKVYSGSQMESQPRYAFPLPWMHILPNYSILINCAKNITKYAYLKYIQFMSIPSIAIPIQ